MRRSAEFATTVRRGRRAGTRSLSAYVGVPTPAAGPAHVGFVVGRAVGSAVVRNRVRRRLRHLMAARIALLPPGARVVVRAHPVAATLGSADLGTDLDRCLERLVTAQRTRA